MPTAYAAIQSDFSDSDEGWTANPYELAVSQQPLDLDVPGGGILHIADLDPLVTSLTFAPVKFQGNLLRFDEGTFSYDLRLEDAPQFGTDTWFGRVFLSGPETSIVYLQPVPSPRATWQRYTVPMTAEAWEISQATWERTLQNVDRFDLALEAGPYAQIGLDNVTLREPATTVAPEPSTTLLFLIGFLPILYRNVRSRILLTVD